MKQFGRHGALLVALGVFAACTRTPPPEPEPEPTPAPEPAFDPTPPADAEKTASGIAFKVLKPGSGDAHPAPYDKVRVNFSAWNSKGKVSDGSAQRGGPQVFSMKEVIAGWTESLQLMRVGEARKLWIPDQLVYPGRPGYPRPPSIFEIELLEIIPGVPPQAAPPDVAAAPRDARKTKSGLAYRFLKQAGAKDKPRAWDRVTIHFTGWTADGVMFDSSRSRERTEIFDLAKVMPGWREGLQLMAAGDSARFWIPEALAYRGEQGEPKGMLVFDIELVSIEHKDEPPRAPASVAAPPHDAVKTASGLAYRIITRGPGTTRPGPADHVEMHYSAWTADGELFDSSVTRGKPVRLALASLIPGWAEGLQLMAEGDKALLWIPESLAYAGRDGSPKGMLVYEVELLELVH